MHAVRSFCVAIIAALAAALAASGPAGAANGAPSCSWAGGTPSVAPLPGEDDYLLLSGLACGDPDGDALVVRLVSGPSRVVAARPEVIAMPTPGGASTVGMGRFIPLRATPSTSVGADSLVVRAFDGHAESGDVTVPFTVVAHSAGASLDCDLGAAPPRELYNHVADFLYTGCRSPYPLRYTTTQAPAHGRLLPFDGDGQALFLPDAGYVGEDSVTFLADDGRGQTTTVTRPLRIIAPSAPTCDQAQMMVQPMSSGQTRWLWPDGCQLHGGESERLELVSHDDVGTWSRDEHDTSWLFTAPVGFTGDVHYAARVVDSIGMSEVVTGTLRVSAPPPEAGKVGCSAYGMARVTRTSRSVVVWPQCSGDNLAVEIVEPPSHGTLMRVDDEEGWAFRYTPTGGFTGLDSFTYRATGQDGPSVAQRMFLQVLPDDPSALGADSRPRCQGGLLRIGDAYGFEDPSCSDGDGDPVTAEVTAPGPEHGAVTLASAVAGEFPSVRFAPVPGYVGLDAFALTASDGMLTASMIVPVWVRVPTAAPDTPAGEPTPPPTQGPADRSSPPPSAPAGRRLARFGGVELIDVLRGHGRPGLDGIGFDRRTGRAHLGIAYNGRSVPVRFGASVTLAARSGHAARAATARKRKTVTLGSVVVKVRPGQTAALRFRVPVRLRSRLRGSKLKVRIRYVVQPQGGRVKVATKTTTLKIGAAKKAKKKRPARR